jgi:hypothetical protein
MAIATADLIAWRDRLVEARMMGTRAVQDADGSRVEYRSDAEMARAIAAADTMIAAGQPVTTIRFSTSKGL